MLLLIIPLILLGSCRKTPPPSPPPTSIPPVAPIPPDNFIGLVKIIDHPGDDLFPKVSPEGTKVAYMARKIDNLDVFYFYPGAPKVNPIQVTRHVA